MKLRENKMKCQKKRKEKKPDQCLVALYPVFITSMDKLHFFFRVFTFQYLQIHGTLHFLFTCGQFLEIRNMYRAQASFLYNLTSQCHAYNQVPHKSNINTLKHTRIPQIWIFFFLRDNVSKMINITVESKMFP